MPIMSRNELLFAVAIGCVFGLALTVATMMLLGTRTASNLELSTGAFCGFAIIGASIMVKNASSQRRGARSVK